MPKVSSTVDSDIHILLGNITNKNNKYKTPKYFKKNIYSDLEYYLIKEGLNKFYNIKKFKILYTPNGKPYIKNKNIHISITNSKHLVGVVFSRKEIGIDIEYIKKDVNNIKKYIKLESKTNNVDTIIEFCKRESNIKKNGLTLKNINELNINKEGFIIYNNNHYITVINY